MSIAGAFNCRDGIILCSDSQETSQQYLKISVPKVVIRPQGASKRENCWAVFAGAGDGPLIDKLVSEMWAALENGKSDWDKSVTAMEDANKIYHQELVTLYQEKDPYYPHAELIYAVSLQGKVGLFKATGPIINSVERYELTGCGEVIARYVADRFFPKHGELPSVRQAIIYAFHALDQTKAYAEGCGGENQIVTMIPNCPPQKIDLSASTAIAELHGLIEAIKESRPLTPPSPQVDELLNRALGARGTPKDIAKWAKRLAGDIADLTD